MGSTKFHVYTEEYESWGGELEPPEIGVDWVEVDVPDDGPMWRQRRAAMVAAIPRLRVEYPGGLLSDRGLNPFAVLTAKSAAEENEEAANSLATVWATGILVDESPRYVAYLDPDSPHAPWYPGAEMFYGPTGVRSYTLTPEGRTYAA
ncbi:MAG: hypothetical protein GY937_22960 [bacterium]|nr:hypothetical protein [bacterium]